MSFQTFLNKYNGQRDVGNTEQNKGECVGLSAVWIDELNLPHVWGDAADLFVNADENYFEKILNTIEALPQMGDIIVWSRAFNGAAGHTGICTGTVTQNNFECFEQNDPLGSNCHLKTYNYNFVSGWLRPLNIPVPSTDTIPVEKKDFENMRRKCDIYDKIISEKYLNQVDNKTIVLADITSLLTKDQALIDKDKQLQDATTKADDLQKKFDAKTKELADANAQIATLTTGLEDAQKSIDKLTIDDKTDREALQALKDSLAKPQAHGIAKIIEGLKELFGRK